MPEQTDSRSISTIEPKMIDTEFVAWSRTRFAGPTMGTYSCLLSTTTARFAGTGLIVWLARPTSETFIPRYRVELESWTHVSGRRALFRRGRRRRGGELVQCLIVENKRGAGEVFLQVPYR
jgi:hypothetical protein